MALPFLRYGAAGLEGFDSAGGRRIWLDPVQLLLSFFDANGSPRCEMGNLPARGISPAHFGFRVNDANGNPIADSQGLIATASSIAQASLAYGSHSFAGVAGSSGVSGFGGEVTLLSTTFTTPRPVNVKLEAAVMGIASVTGGVYATQVPIYLRVTGQANGSVGSLNIYHAGDTQGVSDSSCTSQQLLTALPAGTYTVGVYWNSVNQLNDSLTVRSASLIVQQLGS